MIIPYRRYRANSVQTTRKCSKCRPGLFFRLMRSHLSNVPRSSSRGIFNFPCKKLDAMAHDGGEILDIIPHVDAVIQAVRHSIRAHRLRCRTVSNRMPCCQLLDGRVAADLGPTIMGGRFRRVEGSGLSRSHHRWSRPSRVAGASELPRSRAWPTSVRRPSRPAHRSGNARPAPPG